MKKYRIRHLYIELTRKCNYKCVHCLRGDAQNQTITPEIIDTMFTQCSTVDIISLIGGESLLEIETLKMLLKKIDEHKIDTKCFTFVTNGSVLDASIFDALNDFVNRVENRIVSVKISNDIYHNTTQTQKAIDYYTANNPNKQLISVTKTYDREGLGNCIPMGYDGRAIELYKQNAELQGKAVYPENNIKCHQICISDNTINCQIGLCANGNITLQIFASYEREDRMSIGNILKQSLDCIVTKHNDTCPYLCDECYTETSCMNMIDFNSSVKELVKIIAQLFIKRNEYVWALRQKVKECYPNIPMRAIIKAIQVKEWLDWLEECAAIDGSIPKETQSESKVLAKYNKLLECANICVETAKETDVLSIDVIKELVNSNSYYVDIDVCNLIPNTFDREGKLENMRQHIRQKEMQKYGLDKRQSK